VKLYHIQFDGESYWVEAPTFRGAIEAWKVEVRERWGDDFQDTDEPDSVHLVHDEPVIRWP